MVASLCRPLVRMMEKNVIKAANELGKPVSELTGGQIARASKVYIPSSKTASMAETALLKDLYKYSAALEQGANTPAKIEKMLNSACALKGPAREAILTMLNEGKIKRFAILKGKLCPEVGYVLEMADGTIKKFTNSRVRTITPSLTSHCLSDISGLNYIVRNPQGQICSTRVRGYDEAIASKNENFGFLNPITWTRKFNPKTGDLVKGTIKTTAPNSSCVFFPHLAGGVETRAYNNYNSVLTRKTAGSGLNLNI